MPITRCKSCGENNMLNGTGTYDCLSCKQRQYFDPNRPNLYWTRCKSCKVWLGHEKYMTSIECSYCGNILDTLI